MHAALRSASCRSSSGRGRAEREPRLWYTGSCMPPVVINQKSCEVSQSNGAVVTLTVSIGIQCRALFRSKISVFSHVHVRRLVFVLRTISSTLSKVDYLRVTWTVSTWAYV